MKENYQIAVYDKKRYDNKEKSINPNPLVFNIVQSSPGCGKTTGLSYYIEFHLNVFSKLLEQEAYKKLEEIYKKS